MIFGLGNDIVDIRRMEQLYLRYGERLRRLIFTDNEWAISKSKKDKVCFFAKRFAAKEALVKALGTGFGQTEGIVWRDIDVSNNESGKPGVLLRGKAFKYMGRILTEYGGCEHFIHLSLSDEFPYAIASVIIELVRK
ncbi:MAG: holo-ACP synthase [Holosporales bacterium]|jgi:holo-[acyl-carrier protein] synthase|nr:holo-ACP synthase [Holosporales bacterium]